MNDLISREAVLENAIIVPIANVVTEDKVICRNIVFVEDIQNLPSVTPQPEVIRCKDCKHWTNNIGNSELRNNYCNEEAHGFYYRCSGDDYCSFAERRSDG